MSNEKLITQLLKPFIKTKMFWIITHNGQTWEYNTPGEVYAFMQGAGILDKNNKVLETQTLDIKLERRPTE